MASLLYKKLKANLECVSYVLDMKTFFEGKGVTIHLYLTLKSVKLYIFLN